MTEAAPPSSTDVANSMDYLLLLVLQNTTLFRVEPTTIRDTVSAWTDNLAAATAESLGLDYEDPKHDYAAKPSGCDTYILLTYDEKASTYVALNFEGQGVPSLSDPQPLWDVDADRGFSIARAVLGYIMAQQDSRVPSTPNRAQRRAAIAPSRAKERGVQDRVLAMDREAHPKFYEMLDRLGLPEDYQSLQELAGHYLRVARKDRQRESLTSVIAAEFATSRADNMKRRRHA